MPDEIFKPGDVTEGFRIMSELGRGAASVIYLAQEVKTKQVWALKHVTKESPKDQRFLDQAEQEYLIASQLNHKAIRRIDRLIKKKQNLLSVSDLWLVMEVVDGASLEVEPPDTFEEAASVFEQVARGLSYMHSRGFVHADMKPNNIIVGDAVKIIDLGQSCRTGTVKERIQGTPDYIAPEQVHRRPITEKTDIYNLGATMYKVLTRHFVPTALAKTDSLVGSRDDHLMQRPKQAIEINRRIPEMLNRLIMDCVEIDASRRPGAMEEVADRLNFVRAKLLAEQELRRSGMLPRFTEAPEPPAGVSADQSGAAYSQTRGADAATNGHTAPKGRVTAEEAGVGGAAEAQPAGDADDFDPFDADSSENGRK